MSRHHLPARFQSGARELNPSFKLGKLALNRSTSPAMLVSLVTLSSRNNISSAAIIFKLADLRGFVDTRLTCETRPVTHPHEELA